MRSELEAVRKRVKSNGVAVPPLPTDLVGRVINYCGPAPGELAAERVSDVRSQAGSPANADRLGKLIATPLIRQYGP